MSTKYQIEIQKTLHVHVATFNDELVAYRCELIDEHDSSNTKTWEGVTEKGNLPSQEDQYPRNRYGCMLRKGAIEKARLHGWDTKNFSIYDHMSEHPFTNLNSTNHDRVLLKTDSHMLFDASGKVLPVARHFDYMRGWIHNGKYDLEIALEHLKKNPNVRFNEAKILRIPYYNAETHRSRHLDFTWSPDQETYERAWEVCKRSREKHPCLYMDDAIYELDLLGLTACGADMYPGNASKSRDDEPDEDEDDWDY